MGMGEEMLEDMMLAHDLEDMYIDDMIERKIWTTKDGSQIKIKKMSIPHLQNTIKYLERDSTPDTYFDFIKIMKKRLRKKLKVNNG